MKRIFISYRDDEEGRRYKNLLVGWAHNDFSWFNNIAFEDESIGTSINSSQAPYIKTKIKEKIKKSDILLCLIGEDTHNSKWVEWEVEQAVSLQKKIVAVKIKNNYKTPYSLYGVGAKWAKSFKLESIENVI